MKGLPILVVGMVRLWAATYTRGLPADRRSDRVREIDSDLWDHRIAAQFRGQNGGATALEILARSILGVPADLLWRLENGAARRVKGRNTMNSTPVMRIGLVVASLLLGFLVVNGAGIVLGAGEYDSRGEQIFWGFVFLICPLIALIGLWLSATRPGLGLGLVITGVVTSSLAMFWMAVVILPVGIAIVAFTIRRGGIKVFPGRRTATV